MIRRGIRSISSRPGRIRPRHTAVEALEPRLAPAGIVNGDFSISDPADPGYGFTARGGGSIVNGVGVLTEGTTVQAELSQTFTIAPGTTALRFTIVASGLIANGDSTAPDAFEVALLNATTLAPLIGPPTGLSNTDSFLNIQQTGQVYYAPQVSVPGAGASGSVASLSTPLVVTVDISNVPAGTSARVAFDLVGFSPATSSIKVDDLGLIQGPTAPPVSFILNPSTDSGTVGDDLTRFTTVDLVGATSPGQTVALDTHGGSFGDGTATADPDGRFAFTGVALAEGPNTVRVRATNVYGTDIVTRTINVDTRPPVGALQTPAPGSAIGVDPGYVAIRYTDVGAAGVDPSTYKPANVALTGVTVNRVEDVGGGLVRYHYDNQRLAPGLVTVAIGAGQVADRAGNLIVGSSQSFAFQPGVSHPPAAVADAYTLPQGSTLSVAAPGVLANDASPDGKPLGVSLVDNATHGVLELAADGSFTYTPMAGYVGRDSFTYRAGDGALQSNVAAVSLTVNATAGPPVARDDAYHTIPGVTLTVAAPGVLANDTDPGGNPLTASLVTSTAHGVLSLNTDGSFIYTPTAGYGGPDTFTYRAGDGASRSNVASVTLTGLGVAVHANDDAYTFGPGIFQVTSPVPTVLANDTGPSGRPTSATLVAPTKHGTITLHLDGSFAYIPVVGYSGPDSFTYFASDGPITSNVATVSLTDYGLPAPVAAHHFYTALEGTTLEVAAPGVLAGATDPSGKPLGTYNPSAMTTTDHGSIFLKTDGSFRYTPTQGYTGDDFFTYFITDGTQYSNAQSVAILIEPPGKSPLPIDDHYTLEEGTTLTVVSPGVLANDLGIDKKAVAVVARPAHGMLSLNADGSFAYTPAVNYTGPDAFTYRVDPFYDNLATVSLSVTPTVVVIPVPLPPISAGDAFAATRNHTLNVAAPGVLGNDRDPAGAALTAILVAGPTHGTLTLKADGSFTYTPAANYVGPDSFTYRASDGTSTGNVATVSLTVTSSRFLLLPDTHRYNYIRRRRAIDPPRFDAYHPRVGAFVGLEVDGLPTGPAALLPTNARFRAIRAARRPDPARFDASKPIVGALIRLESPGVGPPLTRLLPATTADATLRARRAANPGRFDLAHPYIGALIRLEVLEGATTAVRVAAAHPAGPTRGRR